MELRHLRYFVAVAEELNFRRAAEQLRVAQPSLSKQIKDLEHDVRVKLLDRNTAGVALTDAGGYFLEEARGILAQVERAVAGAQEAEAGRMGTLTIANVGAISAGFLPSALAAFREKYPEVDVTLEEMFLPDQVSALSQGRIQVGFLIDSGEELEHELERFKVLEGTVAVALSAEHPLARQPRISIHDLAKEKLLGIAIDRHDMHRNRIESIFKRRRVRPRAIKPVNSFESLFAMIEGNQGISFLAPVKGTRRGDGVVYRSIKEDDEDLRFQFYAVWRRRGSSQLALNFVDVLRALHGPAPSRKGSLPV